MEPRYKLITAPVLYPAGLADLKRNLHIPIEDIDEDRDRLLQDLLFEAITASQTATGRQYCPATYTLYLDEYPLNDEFEISKGPVSAILSVKYYAQGASSLTTLDPAKYQLDNSEISARVRFLEPFIVDSLRMNVIEVQFTAGWDTAAAVPKDLKQAIILRATEAYTNPENKDATKWISAAEAKERNHKVQRY
jgi:uncharacterized phiE125 gp8 family phage protein